MFALFAGIIAIVLGIIGVAIKFPYLVILFYLAILLPGLVFTVSDSKPGANQYGPNPKEIDGVPAHV